jgi:hypothetical protein
MNSVYVMTLFLLTSYIHQQQKKKSRTQQPTQNQEMRTREEGPVSDIQDRVRTHTCTKESQHTHNIYTRTN